MACGKVYDTVLEIAKAIQKDFGISDEANYRSFIDEQWNEGKATLKIAEAVVQLKL